MAEQSGNEFTSLYVGGRAVELLTFSRRAALWVRFAFAVNTLFISLCACDHKPAPHVWPAGTVVAIDDIPVTSAEVAQDMLGVILVAPESVDVQLKRLAFNEIALPRAVMRTQVAASARDTARRSIDEEFTRRTSGKQIGPRPVADVVGKEVSGGFGNLGMSAWGIAMNLEVGAWSEVFESPGAFARVRLLERKNGASPAATNLRVDQIEVRYAPKNEKQSTQDEELQRHKLTIVDPAWDTIVPERMKYLMGVHKQ